MNAAPQTIGTHALLYKTLTRRTWRRVHEAMITATYTDDHKGCAAEFCRIAHSLNDRTLRVNGVTPTEAILSNGNHLATLKEDRNMVARRVLRSVATALGENITIDMLLDPGGKHMGGINLTVEGHPDGSLQRDFLRRCGSSVDMLVKFCVAVPG